MRRLRYQVACSLDGYIAGPDGEFDWIPDEPSFDFFALFDQFDTLLMGRSTYEILRTIEEFEFPNKQLIVASRTLNQADYSEIDILNENLESRVRELLLEPGKDIWLYGGGKLFSQLLKADLVDTVELAYIPILLGGGIPLLTTEGVRRSLTFVSQQIYPSGMVLMNYQVNKL